MNRPQPPIELLGMNGPMNRFAAAPDLREWIVATFIEADGPLHNADHAHLEHAALGVLWTNAGNERNMRVVIGQAELMPPMAMGRWQRARAVQQIEEWFGGVPDFLLTFHSDAAASMDDASFCALVEHELYHCGQKRDIYGAPKFTMDGRPSFGIRGHDVEEFVGVVARYGVIDPAVAAMVEVAQRVPTIGIADIAGACGTCALKAA